MVDSASASAAAGDLSSSRMTSSFVKVGDRTRFSVELRPDETTIISWKKFVKDATKASGASSSAAAPAPPPSINAPPSLGSRIVPGEPVANDLEDAPAPNRFNAVIEKIERLYMGKDSSDDEDMADVPDDDQYDTEDSFIDDEELDEYFEVDKSKTKHDGYFINRGTLEKVSEPLELSSQQPKKRRRKESTKAPGDVDLNHHSDKPTKVGRKRSGQFDSSIRKSILPVNQPPCVKNMDEMKNLIQPIASETHPQKLPNGNKPLANFTHLGTSNGDASSSLAQSCDKQKTTMLPMLNPSSKLKDNVAEDSVLVVQQTDKSGMHEKIDLNLPDSKHTMQSSKPSFMNKKEGSTLKPKANSLEKAIRELEKMVAELRPPTSDAQDNDAAANIKRRLPREIKLKLAKVAKLANASNGKVSKELLNRLMGIVGHLCQIRTLKRHLNVVMDTSLSPKQEKDGNVQQIPKEIVMNTSLSPKQEKDDNVQQIRKEIMMNTSLSPKQGKDDKFQQIKKEIIELIQARATFIPKGAEQQSGGYGDANESGNPDKALKGKFYMDVELEDKICDIYDVFADCDRLKDKKETIKDKSRTVNANGLDKDAAPQVRKLYVELAELWPKGFMDNHGIKRAIRRAKERKGALNGTNKEEKIKRKVAATNMENHVHVESSSLPQLQLEYSRVGTDPTNVPVTHQNKFIPNITASLAATAPNPTTIPATSLPIPVPSTQLPNFERTKHEKVKASHSTSLIVDGVVVKKKVKKRAEISGESGHSHVNKLSSHHGDNNNRQKQHKHVSTVPLQGGSQNKSSYDIFRFDPLT